jgi:diguanylate cyclase (GGDEF)-like protein
VIRYLAIVLCSVLASTATAVLPGPPAEPESTLEWRAFRTFGSADGLPQNSVLALAQDRDGFLYAGTEHGLARYDGRDWRVLELPAATRSYAVGALLATRDGALWIGTDSAGVWRAHGTRREAVALPVATSHTINALWEAPDGRVWIAAGDGLFRCVELVCERIEGVGQGGARSLFGETREGRDVLWVGTNDEGAVELADPHGAAPRRSGLAITRAQGLPNTVALSITRFAGDLWIGSGRGLARFDGERVQAYSGGNGFPSAMVFALLPGRDAQGDEVLFAALRPGGVAEIRRDGRWRLIDSGRGLPSNAAHSLLRERYRGALWIGTMKAGVTRVEPQRWAVFDERMGLPDRIVVGTGWSQVRRELWVGTARGAVVWRAGRFQPLLPASHATQLVYDLLDAPDGTRWIAHAQGVQRWRGDALELDYRVDNSALPAVSADQLVLRRAQGDIEIYVATGHGLARWREADGLTRVEGFSSDRGHSVSGLAVAPDPNHADSDVLWLATREGLARLDAQGWTRPDAPCVHQALLADLSLDADETLWLATRNGLRRRDPGGRCVEYPGTAALGALTHVRRRGDEVFVFGARGAMRLPRDADPASTGQRYGTESGLVSPEIIASTVDDAGRVFGATAAGLAALAVATSETEALPPPPLHLVAAEYGAARHPLQPGMELPEQDNAVRFEVRLLAFEREAQTRYRARLQGLSDEFSAWSADAVIAYPHLPPGAYRLHVEASDADGVSARLPDFAFAVAAPWWQRPWAIALIAAALIAAGLLLGRWRSRAARRRAAALEAEIAARTRELAQANAQLEQAAVTDPLTGLKNRRYFALAAPAEAERARRAASTQALLVVLLDIDHFKRINDSLGHEAGDRVLVEVAHRLQQVARGGDIVLRWGGEEFLLLLRDVERRDAAALLQRFLQQLATAPIELDDHRLAVSASIGAACFPDARTPSNTLEHSIANADAALYRAKREGRDRAMLIDASGHGEPACVLLLRES